MAITELWNSSRFSTTKRVLVVMWCFLEMIFFSGVHYGWFQVIHMLKADGIFDSCSGNQNSTLTAVGNETYIAPSGNSSVIPVKTVKVSTECREQEASFSYVFYVASMSQTCGTIFIGLMYDILGVRAMKLTSCAFFVTACMIFAFIDSSTAFLLYLAMPLFSIASSLLIVSNYEMSNLFPRYRFAIIAIYTGAYDSATLVFMIIEALYTNFAVNRSISFAVLGACAFVAEVISAFAFLPKRKFADEQSPKNAKFDDKDQKIMRDAVSLDEEAARLTKFSDQQGNGVSQPEPKAPTKSGKNSKVKETLDRFGFNSELLEQMCSRFYLTLILWSTIVMLFVVNYFATIHAIINRYYPLEEDQTFYSRLKGYILFGGMLTAPISGLVIDKLRSRMRKRAQKNVKQIQKCEQAASYKTTEANGEAETDATVRIHETNTSVDSNEKSAVANEKKQPSILLRIGELVAQSAYLDEVFSLLPSILATTVVCLIANGSLFISTLLPLSFVMFTIFRSFVFGTINSFLMIAFPPHHFGKLFGVLYLVIGISTMLFEILLRYVFNSTDTFTLALASASSTPAESSADETTTAQPDAFTSTIAAAASGESWNGYHSQLILLFVLTLVSFAHPLQIAISRCSVRRKLKKAMRTAEAEVAANADA